MMKKNVLLSCLAGCLLLACNSNKPANVQQTTQNQPDSAQVVTYNNPVMPGDFADPSVVRVGDDYWATATSSEWAPLYPILHSKNLVDWEIVAHVFPDKAPDWADAHFWAPEISYEDGTYYITYSAKKKDGNLCVGIASATSPTGPYTDLGPIICQEAGSIDGFQVRDENGDLYLIWKEDGNSRQLPTPIWGQRLKEDRTALTGDKFELFRNDPASWEGNLVEGPAIVHHGDYFYMLYAANACCGRACTYGTGVARAKSIKGPWQKHPENPILRQSVAWKCPGHGTVITDQNGQDYFLYHAYSAESSVYPGRQGLLDKMNWGEDGWPTFENGAPGTTGQVQLASTAQRILPPKNEALDIKDDFTSEQLATTWQWPVGQKPVYTLAGSKNGLLVLQASPEKIGTVLGKRTTEAAYTATTALEQNTLQTGVLAGLAAIGDNDNAVGIGVRNGEVILWRMKGGTLEELAKTPAPPASMLQLQLITRQGDQMQFAWSTDGNVWNSLQNGAAIDAAYLPPWDRGVRIALTAKGPVNSSVSFNWFEIDN